MERKGKFLITTAIIFLVMFGIGAWIGNRLGQHMGGPLPGPGETIHILFMGTDARPGEDRSRSDTMILASIDTQEKKVALISIPRDTRIKDSRGNWAKINSVNYQEGPEEACRVVGDLLDVPVKHYVLTNFDGFAKIVDILGGVEIDVETAMIHHDRENPELAINISSGVQRLDGQQALNYVRYRGGPTADIGRTQRQQKFLLALADEMFSTSTITKLPKLVPELSKNIDTNIPAKEMIYLAGIANEFDPDRIMTQTLPGYPYTDPDTGISYWLADEEIAKILVERVLAGEKFDVIGDPPEEVRRRPQVKPEQLPEYEPPVADPDVLKSEEEQQPEEGTNPNKPNTDVPGSNPDPIEKEPTGPETPGSVPDTSSVDTLPKPVPQ